MLSRAASKEVFKCIEVIEDALVERLFAQVVPEVLDRIQFG
jgi:hypothetical protein